MAKVQNFVALYLPSSYVEAVLVQSFPGEWNRRRNWSMGRVYVVKKGWRNRGAARVCSSLMVLAVICSRVLEQP